jgi:hypothetical protein
LIFVLVAAIVLVDFSVGVSVAVDVAVGSNVNVTGMGVNVCTSVAVGATSIVMFTFFGASLVQVGEGAAAGAPQAANSTTIIPICTACFM